MVAIKRINVEIIIRILKEITVHGKLKRTRLALYSHLPYDRFQKYLCVMNLLTLVNVTDTPNGTFVDITRLGEKVLDTLSSSESC